MKKTLKTFINTSLLMLFVSHSHGLVFNLTDVNNRTGVSNDPGVILLDNTTHSEFNGIDDSFDGRVTFNFTLIFDTYPAGGTFATFALQDSAGSTPIAIGNSWSSNNWDGYRLDKTIGNVDQQLTTLSFGSNAIAQGVAQAFTMTIDYNAGALDTGTLSIDGDPTAYDIGDYDYSFENIRFRNGLTNNAASATNMSVEVVPEPATYALISGALALVFVVLRRRFKA